MFNQHNFMDENKIKFEYGINAGKLISKKLMKFLGDNGFIPTEVDDKTRTVVYVLQKPDSK